MVTLIKAARRRCDARCYTAEGLVCACICASTNHGVGLVRTRQQMAEGPVIDIANGRRMHQIPLPFDAS